MAEDRKLRTWTFRELPEKPRPLKPGEYFWVDGGPGEFQLRKANRDTVMDYQPIELVGDSGVADDLLAALKEFMDVWTSGDSFSRSKKAQGRRARMWDMATAAVERAEGK